MPYTIDPPSGDAGAGKYTIDPPDKPGWKFDPMEGVHAVGDVLKEAKQNVKTVAGKTPDADAPVQYEGAHNWVQRITDPILLKMSKGGAPVTNRAVAADDLTGTLGKAWDALSTGTAHGLANIDPDITRGLEFAGGALLGAKHGGPMEGEATAVAKPKAAPPSLHEVKVGTVLHKAVQRAETTPEDVIKTLQQHPNRPAFHAIETTVPYAKVVARTPGPGAGLVKSAVNAHRKFAYDQIKGDVGSALGGKADYLATLDKVLEARRQASDVVMKKISEHPVTLNANSVRALRSDFANPAIKRAAQRALADPDPDIAEAGAALNRLHDQLLDAPHPIQIRVRDAQDISRALLDAADAAYKKGEGGDGRVLKSLGRTVRNNAADPDQGGLAEYGAWLKQYGHDSENKDALELGRSAIKPGMDNTAEAIQRELSGMASETAKDHYRKGVGEGLIYTVRNSGGVEAMRKLLKSEEFRDKVHIAFPDRKAYDAFMDAAEERVAEERRNNQVLHGSDTDPNLAARADLTEQGMSNKERADLALSMGKHPVSTLGGLALKKVIESLPESEKNMLKHPETNRILGHALSDPKEMERLLLATHPDKLKKEPIINPPTQWRRASPVLDQALKPPGQ
jgi:hypothetical protein